MNLICLITFRPNTIWCDFLKLFNKYKIFIIVDDNHFDLTDFRNNYNNITFVQVDDNKCKSSGFIDTNFTLNKLISGWDKALYYFGVENRNYDFIWFMEDDVFFNNEDTLANIDNQYLNDDLLSNNYFTNIDGKKDYWHWDRINLHFSPPYYDGMMCVVRFSNKMMQFIMRYAENYNTLFFLEALFPTIAIKNNLIYNNPCEFHNIHYKRDFEKNDITPNNLYHPVKDLNQHIYFRNN